jgi:hypothetical protein
MGIARSADKACEGEGSEMIFTDGTSSGPHWWEWPLMILLSPLYVLVWIVIGLLALLMLVIGIVRAGWKAGVTGQW